MRMLRKISAKTVGYNQSISKAAVTAAGKPVHLFNLAGTVNGTKTGESAHGSWTALVGEFVAVPVFQHEKVEAEQCYGSAAFIHEPMQTAVISALEKGSGEAVEFAIEIWIKPSDTGPGYEYEERPVQKLTEATPLAHLLEKFDTGKQLENKPAPASSGKATKK